MFHGRRSQRLVPVSVATLSLLVAGCSADAGDAAEGAPVAACVARPEGGASPPSALRLNHLQAKGTHNSYHVESAGNSLPDWHYTHAPLDVQLGEQGVRKIELDLHLASLDDDFEVFHLPLVDEQTTCRKLSDCLATIAKWSTAHPSHHALYVQFEIKSGYTNGDPDAFFGKLDAAILAAFPRSRVLAPDDVQGCRATLGEAVEKDGWPSIDATRGMVMFGLDDHERIREGLGREGTSLAGRLVFADSSPGEPIAALAILNDPVGDADAIRAALAANMLVRTFADAAKDDDATNLASEEAALASGATWISSDVPAPVAGRSYAASIPGGTPSRCNPVTAPEGCTPGAIE